MDRKPTVEDLIGIEFAKLGFFREVQEKIAELQASNLELARKKNTIQAILNGITDVMVVLTRDLQIATAAVDSTGMCLFIAFALLDQPKTFQALLDLLNAFHGLNLTGDDVTALGKTILKTEREFNARAGFTAEHDRLPRFFKTEPVAPHKVVFDVSDADLDQVFNW